MTAPEQRVGLGYDVHRTTAGHAVTLGGVTIAAPFALEGHSDADVLLHAIMDALLGAAGLGDIGAHFPPADETLRGVSSLLLLNEVMVRLRARRWRVINLDCTLVAQQPRVLPFVTAMKSAIGRPLALEPDSIGIKATTNEGIGFIGREEGIAALAVALLARG